MHSRKDLTRKDVRKQFPRAISGAALAILLLVMAALASAQDPMAYEFVGRSDYWGTIDLATGAFSQTGNTGELLSGLGVGPGGLLYGGVDASGTLYQVNPANGSLTTVGSSSLAYNDFRLHHRRRLRSRYEPQPVFRKHNYRRYHPYRTDGP